MEKLIVILIIIGIANIAILMGIFVGVKRFIRDKVQELQTQVVDTEDKLVRENENLEQTIIFEMVEQRKKIEKYIKDNTEDNAENLARKIEDECQKHVARRLANEKIYSNKILVVREAK